ncbi:MAG: preprotein translocase subunit SecY [Saccharofermentanales bacterium]
MAGMMETIKNAFNIQDLRKKILFTIGLLAVYRIGCAIPVPGVDILAFNTLFVDKLGNFGQLFDAISGGALSTVSIFAMSITPYINASIIMQLMTVVIPSLERMQKEGEEGRKKIMQIVRYVTIALGLLQATALWYGTRSAMSDTFKGMEILYALLVIASFTAGTAFIMWIGEQINEFGIGNGISLIIFTGIVSRAPKAVTAIYEYSKVISSDSLVISALFVIGVVLVFLAVLVGVIWVQQAERRIPIQYAKKVVGRKLYGGQSTYLPIKVNQSGVIPIIFAMSLISLPATLISFFWASSTSPIILFFKDFSGNPVYYAIYALLIFGFTFFYSMIQFNPIEVSNNLQKNGGFIPGIRPGRPTSDFISKVSNKISWFDGLFLALITLLPIILGGITKMPGLWFGGTAVLILVGVAIDLVNQLESQMMMRHYKGFLD